jgi:ABC-type transport system involved in multi-copper enzyme maturation permease subunit
VRALGALVGLGVRELLHQKLLYNVLVFGVGFVLSSLALVHLTIGHWERVLADMGLSGIGIASSLIAALMGAGSLSREIDRKTLYFTLIKPVSRGQLLLSKFFALCAVLTLNALAMFALVAAVLAAHFYWPSVPMVAAVAGSLLEGFVLASVALLFSTYTTPTLAAIFSLAVFGMGHVLGQVDFFSRFASPGVRAVGIAARTVLPDFSLMNFKVRAFDVTPVSAFELGTAALYAAGYTAVVLALSMVIFNRRDFK